MNEASAGGGPVRRGGEPPIFAPAGVMVGITGVSGFVGSRLAAYLGGRGAQVRGYVRRPFELPGVSVEMRCVGELDGRTEWADTLDGLDTVVHLAARTHAVHDLGPKALAGYRRINVHATRRLAEAAASAGVRRFVYVSSIKVNGEATTGCPFSVADRPAPVDAYGISKWEAEQALAEVAARSELEAVVVRPPLVYGPAAGGNFARLCAAVRRGFVLPLGSVDNRRSLIAVDNLVDLIDRCITHPGAEGQTFLASDGEDVSTPDLIRRLARVMGLRPRLVSVPPGLLRVAGQLAGRRSEVARLLASLQVDMGPTCRRIGWEPPLSLDEGLRRAVAHV